jgi:hypothetical protein
VDASTSGQAAKYTRAMKYGPPPPGCGTAGDPNRSRGEGLETAGGPGGLAGGGGTVGEEEEVGVVAGKARMRSSLYNLCNGKGPMSQYVVGGRSGRCGPWLTRMGSA